MISKPNLCQASVNTWRLFSTKNHSQLHGKKKNVSRCLARSNASPCGEPWYSPELKCRDCPCQNPVKNGTICNICRMEISMSKSPLLGKILFDWNFELWAPQNWAKGSQTQGHLKKTTEVLRNERRVYSIHTVFKRMSFLNTVWIVKLQQ